MSGPGIAASLENVSTESLLAHICACRAELARREHVPTAKDEQVSWVSGKIISLLIDGKVWQRKELFEHLSSFGTFDLIVEDVLRSLVHKGIVVLVTNDAYELRPRVH